MDVAKDQARDIADRNQPRAMSRRGHEEEHAGQGYVRRRDGGSDAKDGSRGPT